MNTSAELFTICLPKIGESITEGTIVRWLKKEGDFVEKDAPLVEIATDKINSEIPSSKEGILSKILQEEGAVLQVGEALCMIRAKAEEKEFATFYSPAVLSLAKKEGLSRQDLAKIPREGDRLKKQDLIRYLEASAAKSVDAEACYTVPISSFRKTVAENMVRSFSTVPHASLVMEVDVTNIIRFLEKNRERYLQQYGQKLTITSFVAKSLVEAIGAYPFVNASLEEDALVVKKCVNLGIAVSVEQGVVVPVIKEAAKLSLLATAKSITDLAAKARSFRLKPEDMEGGSITLTNFGMAQAKLGIPIINHPEVAIIGMGAMEKKILVRADDSFAVAHTLHLTLTFDHRVMDGMYASSFLQRIKKRLEEGDWEVEKS